MGDWIPLPQDFVQKNPLSFAYQSTSKEGVKGHLREANSRIDTVEAHCALADRRIAELQDSINSLQEQVRMKETLLSKQAAEIEDYKGNRITPDALLSTSSSTSIQPFLGCIEDKNLQITELNSEKANYAESSSTTQSDTATILVSEVSHALANMANHMRTHHQTFDTAALLGHSFGSYIKELSSMGAKKFLDFFVTVLDNADNIHRSARGVPQRSEVDKMYQLSKVEVHVLAQLCEYLVGDEYIWEFSYLFCLVHLAGKRSGGLKNLSAVLAGYPTATKMNSDKEEMTKRRKDELGNHPIPDFGDMISLHDNAAALGYVYKSSRQSKAIYDDRVCALILALMTKDKENPDQFLQAEIQYAPYSRFPHVPDAPLDLLDHTPEEKMFLKNEFLERIRVELEKMKADGYTIGDGSAQKNQKPIIKTPSDSKINKSAIKRICPGCDYPYEYKEKKQTCYQIYKDKDDNDYMCGYKLPTKPQSVLAYVMNEDNTVSADDMYLRKSYNDENTSESRDYIKETTSKLKSKLYEAAQYIFDNNNHDSREYTQHQTGTREEFDNTPLSNNMYSQEALRSQNYASSPSFSSSAQRGPLDGAELSGAIQNYKEEQRDQEAQKMMVDDEKSVEELRKRDRSSSNDSYGEDKRYRSVMRTSTSASTRHQSKEGRLNVMIIPQGVINGNPGSALVMKELQEKSLRDGQVDDHCEKPRRRFIAKCQDMGTTQTHFYKLPYELFILPWLHTLMNLCKKCLDLIKNGDNENHSMVAALYDYLSPMAQKVLFGNADNHKSQDFVIRNFLIAGVRHLTHQGVDILGARDSSLSLADMTAEMVYEAFKAQVGATCTSFIALIEEVLHPFAVLCTSARLGPDFQPERIAGEKSLLPVSFVLGQKEYAPAITWDVMLRDFLYSANFFPEMKPMQEWLKNFAVVRTSEDDTWLAVEEIIEHWVRKWKACTSGIGSKNHEFGEALASDIDDLKEKLTILMRQLNPHKEQRPWTDLEPYVAKLTSSFDHYGTGRGTNDTQLKSFDHSEKKSAFFGVDRLIAKGKDQRNKSFQNLKAKGEFLPVSKSVLGKGYSEEDGDDSDSEDEIVDTFT